MATLFDRILGLNSIITSDDSNNMVDQYLANVKDFARAYLFKVYLKYSNTNVDRDEMERNICYIRTTTLPDSLMEEVSTHYMGYQYKLSSVKRFTDWTVTLYIDRDSSNLRNMSEWFNKCHMGTPSEYMVDQNVILLDPQDLTQTSVNYKLVKAWPKSISNITLDYATNDFLTMDVIFSYQYHVVSKSFTNITNDSDTEFYTH